jgi:membrane peptidoglycan carboxypeptidase
MMREVVTAGTAKAAAGAGQVFGKTGTAQFGDGSEATGWFVGYRGDVAFAVVLEKSNDSNPAVKLAAQFLGGL